MYTREAEKNAPTDAADLFFSSAFLSPRLQGWVLLIVAVFMFIDAVRMLLQR